MKRRPDAGQIALVLTAIGILAAVYIFQRAGLRTHTEPTSYWAFIINRVVRLVVNDLACLILIYALFKQKKYLKLALWVFLIELLIILPLYFFIKLSLEGDSEISSPLLSQIHRLVVNPTLMILLILGFLYQKYVGRQSD